MTKTAGRSPLRCGSGFVVSPAELGVTTGLVTSLTLHLDDGRVAIAAAGQVVRGDGVSDDVFWRAQDGKAPEFIGGDWTAITGDRLLAPFEELNEPVFPDGRTQAERVDEIETALNPPEATQRTTVMTVAADGLERVLGELEAEASEADDFVDSHFTRAQVNLYRIRKLILGETAAQKLLINPAIALDRRAGNGDSIGRAARFLHQRGQEEGRVRGERQQGARSCRAAGSCVASTRGARPRNVVRVLDLDGESDRDRRRSEAGHGACGRLRTVRHIPEGRANRPQVSRAQGRPG